MEFLDIGIYGYMVEAGQFGLKINNRSSYVFRVA